MRRYSPSVTELQSGCLLLADDALDFAVFDLLQRVGGNLAAFALFPRFFERGRAQQAADVIGAERRLDALHTQPHTSSAISAIIRSFAHCSSSAKHVAFFGRGEAALRRQAELIEGDVFGRLVDAALDVVLAFQLAGFRGDQAEHQLLVAFGKEAQRLETAGAIAVVFEEIAVEAGMAEQLGGDELIAARGDEGGAEIAAAGMHGDRHVGRLAGKRRVGELRVALRQRIGIVAARLRLRALVRVAHHRPGGIVELQVAAAGVVEGADRRAIGRGEIVEERIERGINLLADRGAALAEMKGRRRRDRHLRRGPRVAFEKLEMLQHRMAGEADFIGDLDALGFGLHAVELNAAFGGERRDAVEALEEVEVPP